MSITESIIQYFFEHYPPRPNEQAHIPGIRMRGIRVKMAPKQGLIHTWLRCSNSSKTKLHVFLKSSPALPRAISHAYGRATSTSLAIEVIAGRYHFGHMYCSDPNAKHREANFIASFNSFFGASQEARSSGEG